MKCIDRSCLFKLLFFCLEMNTVFLRVIILNCELISFQALGARIKTMFLPSSVRNGLRLAELLERVMKAFLLT